jgi:phosphoribosylformylglycinamidine cyclo-ligase
MLSTFNCGIGLVVIVDKSDSKNISNMLTDLGEKVFEIGEIVPGSGQVKYQNSIFAELEN